MTGSRPPISAHGASPPDDAPGPAERLAAGLEALLRGRLGRTGPVPLHAPCFGGQEWAYVRECLDSGWVSTAGPQIARFERRVAEICGTRFAVATVNGTAALHATLHVLGVGPGDLVLCPAVSFVATANAIAQCGAVPLFVDIEPVSLGMDPALLAETLAGDCERGAAGLRHRASGRRVAAAVVVHVFGHPARLDALLPLLDAAGLPLVEDAAQALGSRHRGRPCGGFGRAGTISFNGNKIVTTGGGGAIVTDDAAIAATLRHLTSTARVPGTVEIEHDAVAFNYRMPNLNAALGCAQLDRLDGFVARKRRLLALYAELAGEAEGVALLREPDGAVSNYWLHAVRFADPAERSRFLGLTAAAGLQTRPCWRPLPDLPMYRDAPCAGGGIPVARDLAARIVNLPSGPDLLGDG